MLPRISGCRIRRAPKEKRVYENVLYDSQSEALYAAYLDELVRAGDASAWFRQVPFSLGCPENRYRADFVIVRSIIRDNRPAVEIVVVDIKGCDTRESRRAYRLWSRYGPYALQVVRRTAHGFRVVKTITPDGAKQ